MSLLRQKSAEGGRAALEAFGVVKTATNATKQPGVKSVGMGVPKAHDLPALPPPSVPSRLGGSAAGDKDVDRTFDFEPKSPKVAFNVGMGASTSSDGAGAVAGEPTDTGRRQRSAIDRALQRNEDDYATSSMPLPGDTVSP
jgi:hypothetical protein